MASLFDLRKKAQDQLNAVNQRRIDAQKFLSNEVGLNRQALVPSDNTKAAFRDTAQFGKTIFSVPAQSIGNFAVDAANLGSTAVKYAGNRQAGFKNAFNTAPKIGRITAGIDSLNSVTGVNGQKILDPKGASVIQGASDIGSSFLAPGLGSIKALNAVRSPIGRLAGYSAVRGLEGSAQAGLSELAKTGDPVAAKRQAEIGALAGVGLNAALSPKLAKLAFREAKMVPKDTRDFKNLARATQTFRAPVDTNASTVINGVPVNAPVGAQEVAATLDTRVPLDQAADFLRSGKVDKPVVNADYNGPFVDFKIDPNTRRIRSWDTEDQEFLDQVMDAAKRGSVFQRQVGAVGKNIPQGPGAKIRKMKAGTDGKPLQETLVDNNPEFNVNKYNVSPENKQILSEKIDQMSSLIKAQKGGKMKLTEMAAAGQVPRKGRPGSISREKTLEKIGKLTGARQELASKLEKGDLGPDFVKDTLTIKSIATDTARMLNSFKNSADPKERSLVENILTELNKKGVNIEEAVAASKKYDLTDAKQSAEFYREFVKPNAGDWIDLLRYNSMLSSPNTQINNAFGSVLQVGAVKPIEKTIGGAIDFLSSSFTGKEREKFAGEGLAYSASSLKAIGDGAKAFADVMTGKSASGNLDTRAIPLASSGAAAKAEGVLAFPMKVMEGMDQFFTKLAEAGETGAMNYSASKGADIQDIAGKASSNAERTLFRRELGQAGDGTLSNAIDYLPMKVQEARNSDNPIVSNIAKWTLPFIRTPTNILKQGIEYSPAGVLNLPGNENKTEALARTAVGSAVFAGAATLLGAGRLTWGAPSSDKEKAAFYEAGMQPYSVKVGNEWVSYSKLGPLAFPIAMVAAVDDAEKNAKLDQSTSEQIIAGIAKYGEFFADQSYLKSIGDMLNSGEKGGIAKIASNYPQQLVPYRAAMGWVARLTDQTQRDAKSVDGSFIDKQIAQMMSQIPGLSKNVPARLDSQGNPIPAQNPVLNAFSPLKVTSENAQGKQEYQRISQKRIDDANAKLQTADLDSLISSVGSARLAQGNATTDEAAILGKIKPLANGKYAFRDSKGEVVTQPTQEKALARAAVDAVVSGSSPRVETSDAYYVAAENESGYRKVLKADLQRQTLEASQALALQQAKNSGDYKAWEKVQADKYQQLQSENAKLDPMLDAAKIYSNQKAAETIATQVSRYRSYGGAFKKPKSGKVRKPKVSATSASSLKFKAPKITQPKVKSAKIKLAKVKTKIKKPKVRA